MRRLCGQWILIVGVLVGLLSGPAALAVPKANKKDKETVLLESLTALSGAHLYQTHASIGMIRDLKAKGVYDDKLARQHLATLTNLINLADKQFDAVSNTKIPKEDQKVFEEFRTVNDLLKKQAVALEAFWTSKDKKDGEAFAKVRARTFAKIADLLGIKKP